MSDSAAARLAARVPGDYPSGGHRTYFIPDLNDVALLAQTISFQYTGMIGAAEAAENALAAALAITGGGQGIGAGPLDVVRNIDLGSAAFYSAEVLRGIYPVARGAAYQILETDQGLLLVAESGTLTWTLPRLSTVKFGWNVRVWNRSGANLTISRAGTDVIGAASTSVTVATGTGANFAKRDNTRYEQFL